jgi:DTW domain-containing protein YfiP
VPELLRLPRLSLVAPEGRRSLRKSPPGGMSSLEAIAHALALLEGAEVAAPVHAAHEALVQKQLSQRGYVGPMK